MKDAFLNAVVVLAIVAWLALLWFAADWFSTPSCDPQTAYDHCTGPGYPGGSGPGQR
jgi:hypothetical protein